MNSILSARLQQDLVLASASPRRADILTMLGFDFEVEPADIEETHDGQATPPEHARRLAREKARGLSRTRSAGVSIGADTIVVCDADILGKPESFQDALGMLQRLQGRWHTVHTGLALYDLLAGRGVDAVESTQVRFRPCTDETLRRYVETGECDDKAGAYAIQGVGAMLVHEIRGCYYNVMGLPVSRFLNLLHELRASEVGHAS